MLTATNVCDVIALTCFTSLRYVSAISLLTVTNVCVLDGQLAETDHLEVGRETGHVFDLSEDLLVLLVLTWRRVLPRGQLLIDCWR